MASWNAGISLPYPQAYGIANPVVQYGTFSASSTAASVASVMVASSSGFHAVLLAATIQVSTSSTSALFQSHTTSSQGTLASTWLSTGLTQFSYVPTGIFTSAVSEGIDINAIQGAYTGLCTFIYI